MVRKIVKLWIKFFNLVKSESDLLVIETRESSR